MPRQPEQSGWRGLCGGALMAARRSPFMTTLIVAAFYVGFGVVLLGLAYVLGVG